jgi:hypothetical protein
MASEASKSWAGSPDAAPEPRGFSAAIDGGSLWDALQAEPGRHGRTVVRVQGDDGTMGFLFLDGGQIVHARSAGAVGETAALEILACDSGVLEPCDEPWPRVRTISKSPEMLLLLLRAAKRREDGGASNLVAFPARSMPARQATVEMAAEAAAPEEERLGLAFEDEPDWEKEVTKPAGPTFGMLESFLAIGEPRPRAESVEPVGRVETEEELALPVAAHVAPDGTVLEATDNDFADAVAYIGRLSSLIGELLGLDEFRALECASKEERVFVYTDQDGGLVAGRLPASAEASPFRDRLGL